MATTWGRFLLGCLLSAVLALPIYWLIYQMFRLLGYVDPKEAPGILRSAALIVFVVIWLTVFGLATGDAYDELERRQREKKKRGR